MHLILSDILSYIFGVRYCGLMDGYCFISSHLATQLGYSAGEFQALQLIALAAFGVVD